MLFLLLAVLATFSNAFVASPLRQSRAATQQQVHAAAQQRPSAHANSGVHNDDHHDNDHDHDSVLVVQF